MRKENNVQNIVIIVLAVTVMVMSIGYATYAQTLNINGTATFNKAVWDVHFDTNTFSETSTIKATTKDVGNTLISYTVTLPKPGDKYTFTVNAKNFGTIDAALQKITLSGLTEAQQKFIDYKVSYAGTEYTQTTDSLAIDLAAEASAPIIVTVEYKKPQAASDLPNENVTVSLTAAFDYVDK